MRNAIKCKGAGTVNELKASKSSKTVVPNLGGCPNITFFA